MGTLCVAQGTPLSALRGPKREGNPKRGHMHMCGLP